MDGRRLRGIAATLAIVALCGAGVAVLWSARGSACEYSYNPDNLIRLHVVANSNDPADQALKREVRDLIRSALGPGFRSARTVEEARAYVADNLERIEALAEERLRRAGYEGEVTAELGFFRFPAKTYRDLTLPAGTYEALRVVIGRGEGSNWWCVLFPPLCFLDLGVATGEESSARGVPVDLPRDLLDEEELEPVRPEFRVAVVDWLARTGRRVERLTAWINHGSPSD